MQKRYFFIPLAVIVMITGILVWACKHPLGDGLSIISDNSEEPSGYLSESG